MTKTIDLHHYGVYVKKMPSDEGSVYEATVKELPDIRVVALTPTIAYRLAIKTIKASFDEAYWQGKDFPKPRNH